MSRAKRLALASGTIPWHFGIVQQESTRTRTIVKRVIAVVFLILLGIIILISTGEVYFTPYPYINTRFAPGFSWEGYEKVKPGMTRDDVAELLGDSPFDRNVLFLSRRTLKSGEFKRGEPCHVYSESRKSWGARVLVNVCFDGRRDHALVARKNELIAR